MTCYSKFSLVVRSPCSRSHGTDPLTPVYLTQLSHPRLHSRLGLCSLYILGKEIRNPNTLQNREARGQKLENFR